MDIWCNHRYLKQCKDRTEEIFTDHRSYYSSHERRVSEEETVQAVQGFGQVRVSEVWRERLKRERVGPSLRCASGLGRVCSARGAGSGWREKSRSA